jgi:hypothetical protein
LEEDDDDGNGGDSGGSSPSPCSLTALVFTDVLSSLACFRSSYISSTMAFIVMNVENNVSLVSNGFVLEESMSFVEAISCFRNARLKPIAKMYSSNDPSPSLSLYLVSIHLKIHVKPTLTPTFLPVIVKYPSSDTNLI